MLIWIWLYQFSHFRFLCVFRWRNCGRAKLEVVQILIEFLHLRAKSCQLSSLVFVLSKTVPCNWCKTAAESQTRCFVCRLMDLKSTYWLLVLVNMKQLKTSYTEIYINLLLSMEFPVLKTWDTVNIMLQLLWRNVMFIMLQELQNSLTGSPVVAIPPGF